MHINHTYKYKVLFTPTCYAELYHLQGVNKLTFETLQSIICNNNTLYFVVIIAVALKNVRPLTMWLNIYKLCMSL